MKISQKAFQLHPRGLTVLGHWYRLINHLLARPFCTGCSKSFTQQSCPLSSGEAWSSLLLPTQEGSSYPQHAVRPSSQTSEGCDLEPLDD